MAGQQGSSDRYFQETTNDVDKLVPEGIEGRVPYKGSVLAIVHQLMGGLRASMGYVGCANIEEMRTKPEFVRITTAACARVMCMMFRLRRKRRITALNEKKDKR